MTFATWVRLRLGRGTDQDAGTAIIEFVFVALIVLVPLVYLIVSVAVIQSSSLAVTNSAREAGRAFATAESDDAAPTRARAAARLALADQGISDPLDLRYVAVGASCGSAPIVPQLVPGAVFMVCVERSFGLPGAPASSPGAG